MKKLLALILSLVTVIACGFIIACNTVKTVTADENSVVITAEDPDFDFDRKSLKDFMLYLQEGGKLTFTVKDGMVTQINGKSNTTKSFWMLYTDDTENANHSWGVLEHGGKTYASASLGAEALTVKRGCKYIWAYQTF